MVKVIPENQEVLGTEEFKGISPGSMPVLLPYEEPELCETTVKAPRIVFQGHTNSVIAVKFFSFPGFPRLVLSGSEDKTVSVWSLSSGIRLAQFTGHQQRVCALDCYADENFKPIVLSGSWDETVRVWPLEQCLSSSREVSSQSIGARVLSGHKNRVLSISVVKIENSPPMVCSGSADGFIVIWDLSTYTLMYRIFDSSHPSSWIMAIKAFIHPRNGPMVVSGGKDALIYVWHLVDPTTASGGSTPSLVISGHPSRIHDLAVDCNSTTSPLVVTICRDFLIRLWSLDNGSLLRTLRGHQDWISSIAVCSPPGGTPVLVSGSSNGNMRVWSLSTGEMLRVFRGHTEDVMAVNCITSPDKERDVIVVSGSVDRTVRTWLFTNERFLRVLEHEAQVQVNAMDIFTTERNFIIITGANDGCIRAWQMKYSGKDTLLWTKKVHPSRIWAVKVYKPDESMVNKYQVVDGQLDLNRPFVISAGHDQDIRFSCLSTGDDIGPVLKGHSNIISALFVFHVNESTSALNSSNRAITLPPLSGGSVLMPYLVSASEDNSLLVWSLKDGLALRRLIGHELDVIDVCVYTPSPLSATTPAKKRVSRGGSRTTFHPSSQPTSARSEELFLLDHAGPIIISGGMDNTVRLWSFHTGQMLELLDDSSSQINSVDVLDLSTGPILAAGNGSGAVLIWSLTAPYELLKTLVGHSDEVQCIVMFHPEGMYPILVSGSYDMTVRVWSLENYSQVRTLEGHTSEITALCCFTPGGTDPVVASCSTDSTVRINIDFLGSTPSEDYIQHCYHFDLNGVNSHVLTSDDTLAAYDPRWWRISQVVNNEGPDDFFLNYSHLFFQSINDNRSDFVQVFLPLSHNAITKTNNAKSDQGTLLHCAIKKRDSKSVRTIVSCFIDLLTTPPQDTHYDPNSRIATEDLLSLAKEYPREFEKFICAIKLMPVPLNSIPVGSHYLVENSWGNIELRCYRGVAKDDSKGKDKGKGKVVSGLQAPPSQNMRELSYMSLPINDLIHIDMLKAFCETCTTLDSVAIFDSDVGQMTLSFAWRLFGRKVHIFSMSLYFLYVSIAATSVYTFTHLKGEENMWIISLILIILQLGLDVYFVYKEGGQFLLGPIEYLTDIWNAIDVGVIVTGTIGNLLRLSHWEDTDASRVMLSFTSILMWFNVLFYLRAFESTGPLVSMVLRIAEDMKSLMIVVFLVLLGFSQAFWLLASEEKHHDGDNPFATIQGSLVNSFSFMLGNFETEAFELVPLESFAILLSCLYMLIVSILLLNLLIALMGDSYTKVREKGLAQWKLEQCQLIIENAAAMSESDRSRRDDIYFRRFDFSSDDPFIQRFDLEEAILILLKKQEVLQSNFDKILKKVSFKEGEDVE